jgi:hypothetical protein
MTEGFFRQASAWDLIEIGWRRRVSQAFVSTTASKPLLAIDQTVVNECTEKRTFRMDQISDLAPLFARRLFVQGRHTGRVLPSPPAQEISNISIIQRGWRGIRSGLPELRSIHIPAAL